MAKGEALDAQEPAAAPGRPTALHVVAAVEQASAVAGEAVPPALPVFEPTRTLDRAATGRTTRVAAVGGDETLRRRLLEMGLVPGTAVTVLRRAPLGDPIEVSAHGYLLSLRLSEARHVTTGD
jgi:ferrous iron transport protein A